MNIQDARHNVFALYVLVDSMSFDLLQMVALLIIRVLTISRGTM